MGWSWEGSAWRFDRDGRSPVDLAGDPNGYFGFELREDASTKEFRVAVKRRAGLAEAEQSTRLCG